jgi:hypothetical protein
MELVKGLEKLVFGGILPYNFNVFKVCDFAGVG